MGNVEAISGEYLERVTELAEAEVRRRSIFRIPAYFTLFMIVMVLTPIQRRMPDAANLFALALLLLGIFRWFVAFERKGISDVKIKLLLRLTNFGMQLNAAFWGLFCAMTVAYFELGWTSFLFMLLTCALCAAETSALAPSYRLLTRYLLWMLVPSALVNLVAVGGLRGGAIGGFFVGYLLLLGWVGRVQFMEYWLRLRENARMMAMLDAIPGTVAWISSGLTYLGINRSLAEQLGVKANRIIGTPLGNSEVISPLTAFARALFESPSATRSTQARRTVDGQFRDYFLFGQKYNQDTEAIVLGMDMTNSTETAGEIARERALRFYAARLANRGNAVSRVAQGLGEQFRADPSGAQSGRLIEAGAALARSPDSNSFELLQAKNLLEIAALAFAPSVGAAQGVIQCAPLTPELIALKLEGDQGHLLEALFGLVQNALDSALPGVAPRIELGLELRDGECRLSVSDAGSGVDAAIVERIFEPLFSARKSGPGSGVGLSVAREIAENHGGRLWLESAASPTRFVLAIPASAKP